MGGSVFYKMTGSGNDFVFIDGRCDPVAEWSPERIRSVCARRTGVGADGLVVLEPGSAPGRVRFHFFNSDGSRAPMCGNGALCATRLAARLELAPAEGMCLETDAGTYEARCLPETTDRAEIRLADVTDLSHPEIVPTDGERHIGFATVGVPHLVVVVDDLEAVDLVGRGRALREHRVLEPGGANVNFVARTGEGWAMRTYERGVEGETLACATGAVASALVLGTAGDLEFPWAVRSRMGELLSVSGELDLDREPPALVSPGVGGQALLVFRGIL